jgi:hypothetical protein
VPRSPLHTYLDDHYAGAGAGVALAHRLAGNNRDTAWHPVLLSLAEEIETDEATLVRVRTKLSAEGGHLKRAMALVGERLARLKPNGQLRGYAPLSRVIEAESLMAGVTAKQRLWASLARTVRSQPALGEFDFAALAARAERQLDQLRMFHEQAAEVAFGGRSADDMGPLPSPAPTPS